eukprot:scaffold54383_cov63-Phaeocystis_antarctica.AAC.1
MEMESRLPLPSGHVSKLLQNQPVTCRLVGARSFAAARAPPLSALHLLTHDPLPARVQVEHVLKPLPAPGAHRHQVVACLVGPRVAVVQAPG